MFVCEVAQTLSFNIEQQLAKKTQKERQVAMIGCVAKVMDVVTVRHRLLDAAWETELLSKVFISILTFQPLTGYVRYENSMFFLSLMLAI